MQAFHSKKVREKKAIDPKMKASALVLVVVVLAKCVDAESSYACWGGCYNQCFQGNVSSKSQGLSCGYLCLVNSNCIPPPLPTALDFKYYCQTGCSLKRCIPASNDKARLETCFGWCTNLCSSVIPAQ